MGGSQLKLRGVLYVKPSTVNFKPVWAVLTVYGLVRAKLAVTVSD
jgi:hypothetical protein